MFGLLALAILTVEALSTKTSRAICRIIQLAMLSPVAGNRDAVRRTARRGVARWRVKDVNHAADLSDVPPIVRMTFPTFAAEAMRAYASAPRSSGKTASITGAIFPCS